MKNRFSFTKQANRNTIRGEREIESEGKAGKQITHQLENRL